MSRRRFVLTAIALAVPSLLTAPMATALAPAGAASLCQGQQATQIGAPGGELSGTEGPDVIVTNGAVRTSALGGDDLICATGSTKNALVLAGAGNDVVLASQGDGMRFQLGSGDDTFTGGAAPDSVTGGGNDTLGDEILDDTGVDAISTGGGTDTVVSGQPDLLNKDLIDLGADRDQVFLEGSDGGTVDGGAGLDTLAPRDWDSSTGHHPTAWVLGNRSGTATHDGVLSTRGWASMEGFDLQDIGTKVDATFLGSDADEWVSDPRSYRSNLTVAAGGGADVVSVGWLHHGTVRGQGGNDTLVVDGAGGQTGGPLIRSGVVRLDLGQVRTHGGRTGRFPIRGFEGVETYAFQDVSVVGSGRADRVAVHDSCQVTLTGRGGGDVLVRTAPDQNCTSQQLDRATLIRGGGGADRMRGARTDDVLLGWPGRDAATGAPAGIAVRPRSDAAARDSATLVEWTGSVPAGWRNVSQVPATGLGNRLRPSGRQADHLYCSPMTVSRAHRQIRAGERAKADALMPDAATCSGVRHMRPCPTLR